MPTWIIEPRDPFIARDGRPFGPNPGARATSLAFPYPSTTTGGVRTRAGLDADGVFNANIETIKSIEVRGPFLVELGDNGEIEHWLAPAPADALLLAPEKEKDLVSRQWLAPRDNLKAGESNLPDDLTPVGPAKYESRKPFTGTPRFWFWEHFERWLLDPEDAEMSVEDVKALGRAGPILERRTHVSIQPGTQTAIDGALFATAGLEFTVKEDRRRLAMAPEDPIDPRRKDHQRLAMAVAVGGKEGDLKGHSIYSGLGPLGGERRLMHWRGVENGLPVCPPGLRERIIQQERCRLILLTPACFSQGWRPSWLLERQASGPDVTPKLVGAALGRAQVISGWNFEKGKIGPKPTRRLVPAGSVFFLDLQGNAEAIGKWVDDHWMHCVSDDGQDNRDGFGLAALGAWPDASAPEREGGPR